MQKQTIFWLLTGILVLLFMYAVKSILLPFVVGMLVAYFLDPTADRLEKLGLSRTLSTLIITLTFFITIITITILIAPFIFNQMVSLANSVPDYLVYVYGHSKPLLDKFSSVLDGGQVESAKESIAGAAKEVAAMMTTFAADVFKSGLGIINILSLLFITPVVSFYTLRDWDNLTAKVDSIIPRKHHSNIQQIFHEIDEIISGFVRGQTLVCLILGMFYAIGLTLCGLNFGFIIGLMTGVLTFIPYAGVLAGMTVGILVAFFQFEDWLSIGMVVGVFLLGQFLEGTLITPKIVGDKVKLHPVWIIFGLLAGGSLFGFVGILIAVPISAVIGVLIRFFITKYYQSSLYVAKKK